MGTIMMRRKEKAMSIHREKMEHLFQHAESKDGCITLQAFRDTMSDPSLRTWLAAQDLDSSDVDTMFLLLDDAVGVTDGTITKDELIKGVSHLKGSARSIDLLILMRDVKQLKTMVDQICAKQGDALATYKACVRTDEGVHSVAGHCRC